MSAAYTLSQPARRQGPAAAAGRHVAGRATAAEAQAQALDSYTNFSHAAPEAQRDGPQPGRQPLRLGARPARGRAHDPGRRMADVDARDGLARRQRRGGGSDPLRTVASRARPSSSSAARRATIAVARVISNLRRIDGVERVSLSSSVKNDADGGGARRRGRRLPSGQRPLPAVLDDPLLRIAVRQPPRPRGRRHDRPRSPRHRRRARRGLPGRLLVPGPRAQAQGVRELWRRRSRPPTRG